MVDWLTWPAELLLSAGAIVASWFADKNRPSFLSLQVGFAMLVLAAIVPCLHFCQCWLEIGGRLLIELPNAVFDALLPTPLPATMDR